MLRKGLIALRMQKRSEVSLAVMALRDLTTDQGAVFQT